MDQKAAVQFDGSATLTVAGELLPSSPQVHDALAALLDEKNPPTVSVEFKNTNNVLTYTLTFSRGPQAPTEEESSS